jgi:hypothetical protein
MDGSSLGVERDGCRPEVTQLAHPLLISKRLSLVGRAIDCGRALYQQSSICDPLLLSTRKIRLSRAVVKCISRHCGPAVEDFPLPPISPVISLSLPHAEVRVSVNQRLLDAQTSGERFDRQWSRLVLIAVSTSQGWRRRGEQCKRSHTSLFPRRAVEEHPKHSTFVHVRNNRHEVSSTRMDWETGF